MAEVHQRVEAIRRLARRGAHSSLTRAIEKARAEDIALAMRHLVPAQIRLVFSSIRDETIAAEVLTRVDPPELELLVDDLAFDRLVVLLNLMEVDDEADLLARLPDDLRQRAMKAIHGEDKEIVEEILAWPEDCAGGIMQPIAFRLNADQSCRDAINALQDQHEELEMVFYIYVENDSKQLVGVTSLRNLLTHSPSTLLKEIMESEVITVSPTTDQEEVARVVSRYDLLAIPVVDENRRMLGIVTIDDVIDVIKEEAAEDMMLMAGVGDDLDAHAAGVLRSTRQRLPWLAVTMAGGIVMSEIFGHFQQNMAGAAVLAAFVPVMIGMGGNVGVQAATITVRNIATGRIDPSGFSALIFRELRVGMLIGLAFALILGGFAALRNHDLRIGLAIGVSGIVQLAVAAMVGTVVPLMMRRLGIDPAVATGPFVTTGIDMIGISLFFLTSGLVMQLPWIAI